MLFVYKTTDGGLNWQRQNFHSNSIQLVQFNFDFSIVSDSTIFLAGNRQFYSTHNGGGGGVMTSIKKNFDSSKFKIYPNPTHRNIVLEHNSNQKLDFYLFDLLGNEMKINMLRHDIHKTEFSIGNLPVGIYLLQIIDKREITIIKIVKE